MLPRLQRSGLRERIVGQVWERFCAFSISGLKSIPLNSDTKRTVRVRAADAKVL